jgi:hypothetical protein
MQSGGASEEEVAVLKRQKHDLEMKLKDQVGLLFEQRSLWRFTFYVASGGLSSLLNGVGKKVRMF